MCQITLRIATKSLLAEGINPKSGSTGEIIHTAPAPTVPSPCATIALRHFQACPSSSFYRSRQSEAVMQTSTITPSSHIYTLFSAGLRMCIGAGFTTLEIKIILITFVTAQLLRDRPNSSYPSQRHRCLSLGSNSGGHERTPLKQQPYYLARAISMAALCSSPG